MCGVVAVASLEGPLRIDEGSLVRVRDALAHRGPDGAGLWMSARAALGHRRLAVLDRTGAGAQPMARGSGVLSYNGEIYNEIEIRRELERNGRRFESACDTETVAHALDAWGVGALERLRGMFALAWVDTRRRTLLLARDPLGIKPLYVARLGSEVVAASEIRAILAHPRASARPDLMGVSAYLSTIRTTLGTRTLYAGIESLAPGGWIEFDLGTGRATRGRVEVRAREADTARSAGPPGADGWRALVEQSVEVHLRSDAPTCAMLSGGLDSTILCAVAARHVARAGGRSDRLRTYAAGAGDEGDVAHAARVAAWLGSSHTRIEVTSEAFARSWREMVEWHAQPLSTPNEVAIDAIACTMRSRGEVVAISGEGADELFGGYARALAEASEFHARTPGVRATPERCVEYELLAHAWVPSSAKPGLFRPEAWRELEGDEALREALRFEAGPSEGLEAHLALHRRVNLPGLLERLDRATMRHSIEGRTPLADREVLSAAMALPVEALCDVTRAEDPMASKRPLRAAFAGAIPEEVRARPKASFPLPFQEWCAGSAGVLRASRWLRSIVREDVLEGVASDPATNWRLAWPLINLAMWGERW